MTAAEQTLEAVRALSEGTRKLPAVKTVPIGWQAAPARVVPVSVLPPLVQAVLESSRRKHGEAQFMFARFRAQQTERFTTKDFVFFCHAHGRVLAASHVKKVVDASDARIVGKCGNSNLYLFPTPKPITQGETV